MLSELRLLIKKDLKLMQSSKIWLLMLITFILYSSYINILYVNLDQKIYPVYLLDPNQTQVDISPHIIPVDNYGELELKVNDGYAVGIDATNPSIEVVFHSSTSKKVDNVRAHYALSLLTTEDSPVSKIIGTDSKEMKQRREMTSEVLFFELVAVGFLGIASILFKEKQMGVIRIHAVLPVNRGLFILSKLLLFLACDVLFAVLLTVTNVGFTESLNILPYILLQTTILSLLMALIGVLLAIKLQDFKQFSLLYMVLAVFITSPVFLAGQTNILSQEMKYNPVYYLFLAMKNAFSGFQSMSRIYYLVCVISIGLLFLGVERALSREMAKEG